MPICPKPPCKPATDTTALKKRIVDDSFDIANQATGGTQASTPELLAPPYGSQVQSRMKARLDTLAAARKGNQ